MTDLQAFRLIAPEFSAVDDVTVGLYLDLVAGEVPSKVWGSSAPIGRARLAAHTLALTASSGGSGGVVASESVGGISVSYAVSTADAGLLSSTVHGVEFARLRSTVTPHFMVV